MPIGSRLPRQIKIICMWVTRAHVHLCGQAVGSAAYAEPVKNLGAPPFIRRRYPSARPYAEMGLDGRFGELSPDDRREVMRTSDRDGCSDADQDLAAGHPIGTSSGGLSRRMVLAQTRIGLHGHTGTTTLAPGKCLSWQGTDCRRR